LYLSRSYSDSIYSRIRRQDLKSNRYRYSDLGYYLLKRIIEDKRGKPLDRIVDQDFYRRMGANRTGYNPLLRMNKNEIIPTEIDDYFRYQELHGYVHDMGAAMQGGIGGHAGLFANANDVAKLMQMYLQGGYYGGVRFLNNRTVEKFNKCYFCNEGVRRGVGFDKPDLNNGSPTCNCVSRRSFGHSGFTGTFTWADPDSGILYVFLSNRTYPSATNNQLIRSQLRSRIQQVIYDAIGK
jgi:CubicO group peptidase (beta-lactamase class C family)